MSTSTIGKKLYRLYATIRLRPVWKESMGLIRRGYDLQKEAHELHVEGQKSWDEGFKLWCAGDKASCYDLMKESTRLRHESIDLRNAGLELMHTGRQLWDDVVREVCGKVVRVHSKVEMRWSEHNCTLESGMEFKYE